MAEGSGGREMAVRGWLPIIAPGTLHSLQEAVPWRVFHTALIALMSSLAELLD